jgi:DNA-binding LacI/PurR family transcriptional regulator
MARQLAERLRRDILTRYQGGQQLPSEPELARRGRRSRTTVRKALAILEAQGLIVRQRGAGTFVSDRLPRTAGTTGLFFHSDPTELLSWHFIREMYHGVLEGTLETNRHIHLLLGYERDPLTMSHDVTDRIDVGRIDSVICMELFDVKLLAALGRRMPTVSVDFACHAEGVSSCALDHVRNMDMAVEHLWHLGHRRIGLVGDVDPARADPAAASRSAAFQAAMETRRLSPDGRIRTFRDAAGAVRAIRSWRRAPAAERPTALICTGLPWSAAQAALNEGVHVPGDLSLLSIDDPGPWLNAFRPDQNSFIDLGDVQLASTGQPTDPMDARFAPLRNMAFSSVALPFREMGRWAIQEVLRRVRRPEVTPLHEVLAGHLTSGNTVAPPTAEGT